VGQLGDQLPEIWIVASQTERPAVVREGLGQVPAPMEHFSKATKRGLVVRRSGKGRL